MAHRLQARPLASTTQTFYTKGEFNTQVSVARFPSHAAEPGGAANILERNGENAEPKQQALGHSRSYQKGVYANRSDGFSHYSEKPQSLAEAKRDQRKQFAR